MSDGVERVAPSERLRIAVLGDFDGVHTRSWIRWFIERGHDVHCGSYYALRERIEGATVHVLRKASRPHRRREIVRESKGTGGATRAATRGRPYTEIGARV